MCIGDPFLHRKNIASTNGKIKIIDRAVIPLYPFIVSRQLKNISFFDNRNTFRAFSIGKFAICQARTRNIVHVARIMVVLKRVISFLTDIGNIGSKKIKA
jgi:hypothetical protein